MKYIKIAALLTFATACSDSEFEGKVKESSPRPSIPGPSADAVIEPPPEIPVPPEDVTGEAVQKMSAIEELALACSKPDAMIIALEQSVSYAARVGCSFGVAPNLGERNGYIQAAETSAKILNLPDGKICDISIESPSDATLHYDDYLALTIENKTIFMSDDRILPNLTQTDGVYNWDFEKVKGTASDFNRPGFDGKSYCLGSATTCVIPETDKTGPVSVSLQKLDVAPISVSLAGKTKASLNLTAMGDNDGSDCSHTKLDLKVTFRYIPKVN